MWFLTELVNAGVQYICSHVDGIIVELSIMLFENRHNLQVQNFFQKVVLSGGLAWLETWCFDGTEDQVWTIHCIQFQNRPCLHFQNNHSIQLYWYAYLVILHNSEYNSS